MKRALLAGLIAGFATGIVMTVFLSIGLFEVFSITPYRLPVNVQTTAQIEITHGIFWGIIWGIFYAILYDSIPNKGIRKGLIYGIIIWIISGFRAAVTALAYGFYLWMPPYAIATFFSICITYGLLIGILYKKE